MIEGKDLFDFSHSLAGERLQRAETPWRRSPRSLHGSVKSARRWTPRSTRSGVPKFGWHRAPMSRRRPI